MTVGKDVSSLFPDVINCMQTDNLELKKLVYLYLMNYAKSQQDNAIMAVNTFVKDCEDPNPLIRALAVRTMGCIRVAKMTAYHLDPLRKCLKDDDPYVRKTAAVCVAKLYDIDPELVEESEFLTELKDLISDSNPMVVANAVASITEILDKTESSHAIKILSFDHIIINKLLTALNECSEWGQIFILDAVAEYSPQNEKEAESIVERVLPRLAHANAAVVLSTVKVIMKMLELIERNSDLINVVTNKLAPPLVTLLSAEPEIQYVALRNISLIIQKRKSILKNEMKVFFVKYNDPIYVKLEKLDIMIRLTNQTNIAQVLAELKEYAKEVDVDFVRKSVRAIGRCAIKVESSAERCVSTLIELIQTKVNYVVQEAIVVIKDIFRKYPNKYESIIATLCENLDTLDESEARASMIWIIGEYAERIDNADELLDSFLANFKDENIQVQLQLLTAIVKLFLKRPTETRELVQSVLSLATQNSDNPDLRDRGYIYWRLLSTDPEAAKKVVLAEKPLISEETDLIEPTLLDELICNLASLASVYHKPPSTFVDSKHLGKKILLRNNENGYSVDDGSKGNNKVIPSVIPEQQDDLIGDLLNLDISPTMITNNQDYGNNLVHQQQPDLLCDGLDDLITDRNEQLATAAASILGEQTNNVDELAGIFGNISTENSPSKKIKSHKQPMAIWLDKAKGKGLEIQGTFYVTDTGSLTMEMTLTNHALMPMTDFAIQFNKNSFGIVPAQPLSVATPLNMGQSTTTTLTLGTHGPLQKMNPLMNLQVAVKNNIDVLYFACLVPINILFTHDGNMDKIVFMQTWKEIPQENEKAFKLLDLTVTPDEWIQLLQQNNIFTIQKTTCEGYDMLFQAMKLTNNIWVLVEVRYNETSCQFSVKSRSLDVYNAVKTAYESILGISGVDI